jgi:hypothetical protein
LILADAALAQALGWDHVVPLLAAGLKRTEPIMRILCKKTDTLVGYLYQWNNGDVQPAWLNDAMSDVRYEPMVEAA